MTDALLQFLDAETTIAFDDLLRGSGLAREEVIALVEHGVFEPTGAAPAWRFESRTLIVARRAARLRDAFGVDAAGIALALAYRERIESLERRVRELECALLR